MIPRFQFQKTTDRDKRDRRELPPEEIESTPIRRAMVAGHAARMASLGLVGEQRVGRARRPVIVAGNFYDSIMAAGKAMQMSDATIWSRIHRGVPGCEYANPN